jgi:hypothetical protein
MAGHAHGDQVEQHFIAEPFVGPVMDLDGSPLAAALAQALRAKEDATAQVGPLLAGHVPVVEFPEAPGFVFALLLESTRALPPIGVNAGLPALGQRLMADQDTDGQA